MKFREKFNKMFNETNMNWVAVVLWFCAGISVASAYFTWFISVGKCVIVK